MQPSARRFRAKRQPLEKFQDFFPGGQGQNLALTTVLLVAYSLDSAGCRPLVCSVREVMGKLRYAPSDHSACAHPGGAPHGVNARARCRANKEYISLTESGQESGSGLYLFR